MSNDTRVPKHASKSTSQEGVVAGYDLQSWKGLTALLQVAREAEMSNREYAAFRDLVLNYAQSGGAPELRTRIETTLKRLSAPSKTEAQTERKETKTAVPETKATEPEHEAESQTAEAEDEAGKPDDTQEPKEQTKEEPTHGSGITPKSIAKKSVATDKTETQPPPDNLPVAADTEPDTPAPEPQTTQPTPEKVQREKVHLTPSEIEERIVSEERTIAAYKARINEIKSSVNARVSNPISLVDAGNPIGREYMQALLDAMKASAGGRQEGGLKAAIERLEDAYVAIETYCDKQEREKETKDPKEKLELKKAVTDTSEVLQPETPEQETETPKEDEAEIEATSESAQTLPSDTETEKGTQEMPESESPTQDTEPPHEEKTEEEPAPEKKPEQPIDTETEPKRPEPVANTVPTKTPTAQPAEPIPSLKDRLEDGDFVDRLTAIQHKGYAARKEAEQNQMADVSEEHQQESTPKKTHTPLDTETQSKIDEAKRDTALLRKVEQTKNTENVPTATSSPDDAELHTDTITRKLHEFLLEWDIFQDKKFFGISENSGKEHKLYKAIKDKAMSLVVTGRDEHITPEVKRALNDYVNAWRHEQGIAYLQDETFEHYLRRVIQRIQKRRSDSEE